jgi:hypothetical protein
MIAKHTRALGLEGERNNGVGEGGRRGGGEGGVLKRKKNIETEAARLEFL